MKWDYSLKRPTLLAPSLLSANLLNLEKEVQFLEASKADWIHIDVMDGHFVPNLAFTPATVKAIRSLTALPLDCHLMVSEPERWIEPFAQAGASTLTVHAEATSHLHRLIEQIQATGARAGVALNPGSPLSLLEEVLENLDLVLLMSVNPGFGGQKWIDSLLPKIKRLAKKRVSNASALDKTTPFFMIEVDGGIQLHHIPLLKNAGVNVLVVGSSIFSAKDQERSLKDFQHAILAKP